MSRLKAPLHEPEFAGREWRYVKECLDTGWVSSAGAFVERFEKAAAARLGLEHAVAVSSGTAALHLALEAAGVGRGDEVLMPSLTFIATANAAAYLGAVPRFLDCEETTLGLDPDALEAYLKRKKGRRPAACVPVHVMGHPCRIDAIVRICSRYGVPVIEDATESLGSLYQGRPAGGFGLAAALSFNGNKILTTGGGGMIVTASARLARLARHLSTQAKKDPSIYLHDRVGYNYRLPNLNAALGLAQLERLSDMLRRKRRIAAWYRSALSGTRDLRLVWEPDGARSNFWLNTVQASTPARAAALRRRLMDAGYESRPLWIPCHRQPMYRSLAAGPLPVTERLWRTCFNIPSSAALSRAAVERIGRLLS